MTPAELREYAQVMKAEGVFKFSVHTGRYELVSIEMSQAAIAAAQAERYPQQPIAQAVAREVAATAPSEDDEDRFAFMATEG